MRHAHVRHAASSQELYHTLGLVLYRARYSAKCSFARLVRLYDVWHGSWAQKLSDATDQLILCVSIHGESEYVYDVLIMRVLIKIRTF